MIIKLLYIYSNLVYEVLLKLREMNVQRGHVGLQIGVKNTR